MDSHSGGGSSVVVAAAAAAASCGGGRGGGGDGGGGSGGDGGGSSLTVKPYAAPPQTHDPSDTRRATRSRKLVAAGQTSLGSGKSDKDGRVRCVVGGCGATWGPGCRTGRPDERRGGEGGEGREEVEWLAGRRDRGGDGLKKRRRGVSASATRPCRATSMPMKHHSRPRVWGARWRPPSRRPHRSATTLPHQTPPPGAPPAPPGRRRAPLSRGSGHQGIRPRAFLPPPPMTICRRPLPPPPQSQQREGGPGRPQRCFVWCSGKRGGGWPHGVASWPPPWPGGRPAGHAGCLRPPPRGRRPTHPPPPARPGGGTAEQLARPGVRD